MATLTVVVGERSGGYDRSEFASSTYLRRSAEGVPVDEVDALITRLDVRHDGIGDEAAESLIDRGPAVLPRLCSAVEQLATFGRLGAIEVMRRLGDRSACPALIGLLKDHDEAVREWTVVAVGELGCTGAEQSLEALRHRYVRDEIPPSWTGPVAVRDALTNLGVRQLVIPDVVETAAMELGKPLGWCSIEKLDQVIESLAAHGQVVLYFQVWCRDRDDLIYWTQHDSVEWTFAWGASWAYNVESAREAALIEASAIDAPGLIASVTWMDRSDIQL